MKKLKFTIILIFIFILFGANIVKADKPSITIYLKNMNTTEYTLDILTKPKDEQEFYSRISDTYIEYKDTPIYIYNDNGWMATNLRNELLFGHIKGNSLKTHTFTFFVGVPDEFKVIIQYKDGTIKTSDIIERTELDYEMYLDVNTMKVEPKYTFNLDNVLICMIITIIIELLIAIVINIKHTEQIILVNLFTQILIQSLRLFNFTSFILSFIIAESLVFFIEYVIYQKIFKDIDNRTIIIYTFIANIVTAFLTFTNNIVIFLIFIGLFIIYSILNNKNIKYDFIKIISWLSIFALSAMILSIICADFRFSLLIEGSSIINILISLSFICLAVSLIICAITKLINKESKYNYLIAKDMVEYFIWYILLCFSGRQLIYGLSHFVSLFILNVALFVDCILLRNKKIKKYSYIVLFINIFIMSLWYIKELGYIDYDFYYCFNTEKQNYITYLFSSLKYLFALLS